MKELNTALFNAMYEMEGVRKSSDNPFFKSKYADLNTVMESIKPILQDNDIGFNQFPHSDDNGVGVITRVFLKGTDQYIERAFTLPLAKRDPQSAGSAITYARRYALVSIFNLEAIDDDAESAMPRTINKKQEEELAGLCIMAGTTPDEFCKRIRIEKLSDLAADRFKGAKEYLEGMK